jgi:hypothetical protein
MTTKSDDVYGLITWGVDVKEFNTLKAAQKALATSEYSAAIFKGPRGEVCGGEQIAENDKPEAPWELTRKTIAKNLKVERI